ncbi:hypothetical protein ABIE66_001141 [Peribacillus sp. B2I2]
MVLFIADLLFGRPGEKIRILMSVVPIFSADIVKNVHRGTLIDFVIVCSVR